ncbi:MAG: TonB-dependent receptor [Ignavibacteria bacterium]|nr:TonB-dependent receptor [Ignavibacteria bacterium]
MKKAKIILFVIVVFFCTAKALTSEKDTVKFSLKEVVISALRYPERVLEVPLSVSFIDGKNLIGYRGVSIDEPLQRVPGVLCQSRSGSADIRITVRGFGSRGAGDRSNSGTVRGVKFLLDGIPQTEPDGRTSLDFFDISFVENIEIIRSNASSLWGNSAGSVISFSTVPSENNPSAYFSKSVGSWGLDKNVLKLRTKLGNDGVIFLNSSYLTFDGWRANSKAERLLFSFGAKSVFGEKRFTGQVDYFPTILQLNVNLTRNRFNIPGALTNAIFDTLPNAANPVYLMNKERRDNRLAQVGISLTHNFNEKNSIYAQGFLTSKYLQRSERGTYRDFTRYFLGSTIHYQNHFTINSFSNIIITGFDQTLQDGAILFYNLDSNANRSNVLRTDKKEGASTFGVFFQDEIIYKNISILFGGRYDRVVYSVQDFLKFTNSDEKVFEKFTPKAGLTFRIIDNFSIFGNIGGGIEVPAGNETDPAPGEDTVYQLNPLLNPIFSTTYEFGIKSYFQFKSAIKDIEFEASGFYIDTKNELIPYREGRFYFSAGKTNRMGIELFLKAKIVQDIVINTSFTYLIGKFKDYKVDSSYYDKAKAGVYADFKDNFIPGVPKYYYFASLIIPFYLNFEFSINGISKYFCDDANRIEVPSYNIFNLRIWYDKIYIDSKLNLSLAFSLNNISNKKYVASAFVNPIYEKGTNLPYFIEPGLPRNYLFTISFKF